MCLQQITKCDDCGKDTDGLMTCFLDEQVLRLCPDCMKKDGSFCFGCGQFCAGINSFDFIHPGYCDTCWDEIESDFMDLEEEYD